MVNRQIWGYGTEHGTTRKNNFRKRIEKTMFKLIKRKLKTKAFSKITRRRRTRVLSTIREGRAGAAQVEEIAVWPTSYN